MSAMADPVRRGPELISLRSCGAHELDPLLLDETVEWEQEIDWDFRKSAELIRRYTDSRSLGGLALTLRGEVIGYGYTVIEGTKGLIGDIYMRPLWRDTDSELRLARGILDALLHMPGVNRIEAQLMLLGPGIAAGLQRERFIRMYERILMRLPESAPDPEGCADAAKKYLIETWQPGFLDGGAAVVTGAYAGHVDSQVNDQYRTHAGARRFLKNIVQFPGCGDFFAPGSFLAYDAQTGLAAGMVLASFVAPEVGHVTQICVMPNARGTGLGRELLHRSVTTMRRQGAKRVTLTVTAANERAVELYRRSGFRDMRPFFAYIWERT